MQAIITKYIPATNTKSSRIKASCERGSIIISYDCAQSEEGVHIYAAKRLCAKFIEEDKKTYGSPQHRNPWSARFVTGGFKSGYAHVFVK